jgi:predicted nucleotidyltransferase
MSSDSNIIPIRYEDANVATFFPENLELCKNVRIFAPNKARMTMSEEKRAKIISMIRDTIRDVEPTAEIILYGSRARGDFREDSDWDVLAIIDKPRLTLEERGNIQYPIWDKGLDIGEEINVFPYTKKQWEEAPPSLFKYNVLKEGVSL